MASISIMHAHTHTWTIIVAAYSDPPQGVPDPVSVGQAHPPAGSGHQQRQPAALQPPHQEVCTSLLVTEADWQGRLRM